MNPEFTLELINELHEKVKYHKKETTSLKRSLTIEMTKVKAMGESITLLQRERDVLKKEIEFLRRRKVTMPKTTIDQFNFMLNRLRFYEPVSAEKIDMALVVSELPKGRTD